MEPKAVETLEALQRARALVARSWIQGRFVWPEGTKDGEPWSFCASGALGHVLGLEEERQVERTEAYGLLVAAAVPDPAEVVQVRLYDGAVLEIGRAETGFLHHWNDRPERTQAEVVAAYDRAIEAAGAAGS